LKGFFADFDNLELLAKALPIACSKSWDDAFRYVSCALGSVGCVFRSFSGKIKVFIPVKASTMDVRTARKLVQLLMPNYYKAIDKDGGMRFSFVNISAYNELSDFLSSYHFNMVIENNTKIYSEMKSIKKKREEVRTIVYLPSSIPSESKSLTWNLYDGNLPENIANSESEAYKILFKYAAGALYLSTTTGVALPQVKIAKIAGVSQKRISPLIKRMIKEQIIVLTRPYNKGAGLAAKYRFTGFYLQWAKSELQRIKNGTAIRNNKKTREEQLQTVLNTIKTGNYYKPLFRLTNFFTSETDYINTVRSIQGFEDKAEERETMAMKAWAAHIKLDEEKKLNILIQVV
jgi:hypothetical protein